MESEEKQGVGKKQLVKKIASTTGNVLLCLLILFVFFTLTISITVKKDSDGTATVFGYQLRFVQSSSMEKSEQTDVSKYKIKSIPVKSCVFVEVMPKEETKRQEWLKTIKVGDVLTFKYVYQKQETITHRVIKIEEKSQGGYVITLEGDNKTESSSVGQQIIDTEDENSPNYIIGRVTGQSRLIGLVVYALRSPIGIVCIIIIPCLIMIAFQIMRIIDAVNKEKKEKLVEVQNSQASEIEELRRRVEELQQKAEENKGKAIKENNGEIK